MIMTSSAKYNRKTGTIKELTLKIYPEELELIQSASGLSHLMIAIERVMIKDNERARKQNIKRKGNK